MEHLVRRRACTATDSAAAEPSALHTDADRSSNDDSSENGDKMEEPAPLQRRNRSELWMYFEAVAKEDRVAQCALCLQRISYRTTMSNLRTHLERKHPHLSLEERGRAGSGAAADPLDADQELAEAGALKRKHDLWQYMEIVDKKRGIAQCAICLKRLSFRTTTSNLLKHLHRTHPKVATATTHTFKQQEHSEENTKESSPPPKLETQRSPHARKPHKSTKHKRKPPSSPTNSDSADSDTDDGRYRRRRCSKLPEHESSIDSFGKYIATLLKKMPEDVAMKMQADIVTQIVNAQIVHSQSVQSLVVLPATTSENNSYEISNSGQVMTYKLNSP